MIHRWWQETKRNIVVDTYQIKLLRTDRVIYLSEATREDIEAVSLLLNFDWLNFWSRRDPDCEAIVKLESDGKIQGLIHLAVYPYPIENDKPEYLEIIALEATRPPDRLVSPVGLYLVWYASKMSLKLGCAGNEDGSIVRLNSLESAIDYYRNQVRMEGKGWITLSPDEDGYAFTFSQAQAIDFCNRIEQQYGIPDPT
jgi:hypothetical protein